MSRSFRHRHWIHHDVYEGKVFIPIDEYRTLRVIHILEGDELKKAIREWHSYKRDPSKISRQPMRFRREHQKKYRVECRKELHLFIRNQEHEVMIESKMKLPYWD